MSKLMRLRFRLIFLIIPLVLAVIVLSGLVSSLQSRSALTEIANRHLAFKAEQLRDFFNSEWESITNLGLDNIKEYRDAMERSFFSYAYSTLRSESEVILVFSAQGYQVMRISLAPPSDLTNESSFENLQIELPSPGWYSGNIMGENRVGVVFLIEHRDWVVMVTELEDAFFSEVRTMQLTYFLMMAISIPVIVIALSMFVGHIVRPVERLTATMDTIYSTGNLNQRVEIEFADEIGYLAKDFNHLISTLQENFNQLELLSLAETKARKTAVEREEETLMLLSRVSDTKDEETGAHVKRIGLLSAEMARLLGQNEEQQKILLNSAPLHDIGKIGVPESILLKQGKMTKDERETMITHTLIGHNLLKDTKSLYLIEGAAIALTHHEWWNGNGYPQGLKEKEIPLSGRIVALVDVFDALTSQRPYKRAWSMEETREYIMKQRAVQFDPELVDLFIENLHIFEKIIKRTSDFQIT